MKKYIISVSAGFLVLTLAYIISGFILNNNDNVISASTVVNLGGNLDPYNILGYSKLAGERIETSL